MFILYISNALLKKVVGFAEEYCLGVGISGFILRYSFSELVGVNPHVKAFL
jgi:hypothetical protein